jgi:GNAT superfamily N-acetyltransferase
MNIRSARAGDVSQLLQLMLGLAEFEGYRDRFAVTEAELLERGFDVRREPQFQVFVADDGDALRGYALTYLIPFTFDLRPTLVLKEFFVQSDARSCGIGRRLYESVIDYGRERNVRLMRWQVLPGNEDAVRFYRGFGGNIDKDWDNWVLEL